MHLLEWAFIPLFFVAYFGFRQSRATGSATPGVQRHSEEHFDNAQATVARAVRVVLARRQRYRKTVEVHRDAFFQTSVRPPWGLLAWLLTGTEMTIELQPSTGGTNLVATTKSQWYITGDAFHFYARYIRDFLTDLHNEL